MGTFSYQARSHTVHSKVLKPSLWNGSPWRCRSLHDSTKQFMLINTPPTLGGHTTNWRETWWGSLDNPSLHKKASRIKNVVGRALPHLPLRGVYSNSPVGGGGGREIKSQNKLISREHKLTSCYQMAFLWRGKSEQSKQQYLLFATSNPSEWRVFTTTWKCPHYLGGLKKGRGRGPDCVPDVLSFCLSDHSSAWIFPLSFSFPQLFSSAAPAKAGPRREQRMHLQNKKVVISFSSAFRRFSLILRRSRQLLHFFQLILWLRIYCADKQPKTWTKILH